MTTKVPLSLKSTQSSGIAPDLVTLLQSMQQQLLEEKAQRVTDRQAYEKGIKEADSGITISHSEAKKRMKKWLK